MRAKIIPPSPTGQIFEMASQKRNRGEVVYNFSAGDPALENHPALLEMVMKRAACKMTPYPPIDGIQELRDAFCNWVNRSCLLSYKPDEVEVTCGGKFALYAILASFLNPGDEVILVSPYYPSYPAMTTILLGEVKIIEAKLEKGWKITGEELKRASTPKSKFLLFNNGCNPTGALYKREELFDLLMTAKNLGIQVISDEVYSGLAYEPFISCGSFPEFQDNVFIVQSCSKNFAMSGWRVGFILGAKEKLSQIRALQQQTTSGVSLLSQWGALGALLKADEVNLYVKEVFKRRLSLFAKTFSALFGKKLALPSSAIYFFVPLDLMGIDQKISSQEIATLLMEKGNIATVPGEAFGAAGYLRFACSENEQVIEKGLHQLKITIDKIKGEAYGSCNN